MVSRVSMAPLPRVSGQLQSVKNGAIPTSTPTKSLLRNTKRRIEDALSSPMTDGSPIIAPAAKRARTVTFNPVVEENLFSTIPEPEIASIEDIRRNVRRALEEHTKKSGTDVRYDALKELFDGAAKAKKSENDNLRSHLLALTSCVSLIGKNCSSLVRSIMESSWVGKEEAYIKAYVGFLGHLASTQGAYVGNVLSMLVNKFLGGTCLSRSMMKKPANSF